MNGPQFAALDLDSVNILLEELEKNESDGLLSPYQGVIARWLETIREAITDDDGELISVPEPSVIPVTAFLLGPSSPKKEATCLRLSQIQKFEDPSFQIVVQRKKVTPNEIKDSSWGFPVGRVTKLIKGEITVLWKEGRPPLPNLAQWLSSYEKQQSEVPETLESLKQQNHLFISLTLGFAKARAYVDHIRKEHPDTNLKGNIIGRILPRHPTTGAGLIVSEPSDPNSLLGSVLVRCKYRPDLPPPGDSGDLAGGYYLEIFVGFSSAPQFSKDIILDT